MTLDKVRPFWLRRKLAAVAVAVGVIAGLLVLLVNRDRLAIYRHPSADLIILAEAAMEQQRFDVALEHFEQAKSAGGKLPTESLLDGAESALQLGKTSAAEVYLRELLSTEPTNTDGNDLLCGLLRVAGRNWELRPHALELMRQGVFSRGNLIALSTADLATRRGSQEDTNFEMFLLERAVAAKAIPVRLAEARYFMGHNQNDRALPLLTGIVAEDPSLLDAQAWLGSLLLGTGAREELWKWHTRLPDNASRHPEIWIVRGQWAEEQGNDQAAARCYWEALKRHPDHTVATYRLSQLLSVLGRQSDAELFAERSTKLVNMQVIVASGFNPTSALRLSELLESSGRLWESLGWTMTILNHDTQNEFAEAQDRAQRLRWALTPDTPIMLPAKNLALKVDLSDWPLPEWGTGDIPSEKPDRLPALASRIAFSDEAAAAGISFSFFNGADPSLNRAYMFEFSGGGCAVLDFDGDGWPDLYLTQGCPWPPRADQTKYRDRLYRNLGNGQFREVTEAAGVRGTGYGQGAAVGDIDNDGFPDLYVANIGANQLYHNNGDGTFTDISSHAGPDRAVWTISSLIADLDGDHFPELYDVNYLGGPTIFTQACFAHGGPVQCFPNQFPAETDQLYRNLGDGRFRDMSEQSGIAVPNGKGMGIICADFNESNRLSLFITNDTTNNFFFVNQTESPGGPQFLEQGLLLGVAYSEAGMSASCMGVATSDVNADGLLDLFVTNFQDEANNLYVGRHGLFFDDRIRQSQLNDPGFQMEGWGAQFLDADLDGQLDLVVANGHLDDYPHSPGVNRMPVQFFRHIGDGRFAEVPSSELGPFFATKALGRAVALLDWNRDGRLDFGVTNVDTPFALLKNQTTESGHYLAVRLRATRSARDAIGSKVSIRSGSRQWTQQLTAGDGFSASNERLLMFGLGAVAKIDELKISWPSGSVQTFHDLQLDREVVFIEGRGVPIGLSHSSSNSAP